MASFEFEYAWWEYFLIPWIAGFVGYFTNVLALQLTFYPIEYFGVKLFRLENEPWGLFGWQGIIPTKAKKMASVCFDLMTEKLLSIHEIFGQLDPIRFAEVMEDSLLLMIDSVITEVANEYMPTTWNKIPQEVRDDIIVTANQESGAFLAAFMKDMQEHVEDVVDIKELCVSACLANKELIVKIFQECGDQEFIFIRRSGFYFGFMFGLIQMTVWLFYPASWILPVAGFLVGWVTNWIALKIIFEPLEPKYFLCWTIHGIFLKRQAEVSETFARVICTEILHVRAMWDAIFTGPLHKNFFAMLRAHTLVFTDKMTAEIKPLAIAGMGSADKFNQMKESIAQKVLEKLPDVIDASYEYTQQALDMEATIRTKMSAISSAEFEGVLHPAFQEDEIQLIALGGVLGAIVGVLQLVTIFA
mmetsp:Transcript_14777/g.41835  ORF Transcript_14777/g.41835 Transcript_14777/m.41835 type:complete len:416 (+) Transcript_14777:274-1521(+)|eukprot:CAMPEP_0119546702 /NCGR_PEP_ID=MMETSP1352-20130426/1000_1 /TAXON_ID=265584 /ORGANISM="Stauroneis constricta, Strain CCMP1120" /LENGTH=415 /DNA_ID=CAMNT_0007591427 /DNA_START=255 /DNA_END=1502 /DNA_ORIENTATION=+